MRVKGERLYVDRKMWLRLTAAARLGVAADAPG
jgi:hypothetical protein